MNNSKRVEKHLKGKELENILKIMFTSAINVAIEMKGGTMSMFQTNLSVNFIKAPADAPEFRGGLTIQNHAKKKIEQSGIYETKYPIMGQPLHSGVAWTGLLKEYNPCLNWR